MKQTKLIILIVTIIFFFDQLTKQLIRINNVQTTNGVVDITYVTNTGTLWSLFAGANNVNIIFIIISLLALGVMIYLVRKEQEHNYTIPFALLIAGILGNLTDRIFFGAVIDWINFHFWPIFNIADSSLVLGVCWMLFLSIREEVQKIK